jgi:hypothetical protein
MMLHGQAFSEVLGDVGILAAFAVVFLVLAAVTVRRT